MGKADSVGNWIDFWFVLKIHIIAYSFFLDVYWYKVAVS